MTKKKQPAEQPADQSAEQSAIRIEDGNGKELTAAPVAMRHYAVYPRDPKNPPSAPQAAIRVLREQYPASLFTYFATR